MKTLNYRSLPVGVYDTSEQLGLAAATDLAAIVQEDIRLHGSAALILATGNSQLTFMDALATLSGIPWDYVTVFNMDSYLGMPADHPASFTRYMREKLIDRVHPRAFYDVQGHCENAAAELERLTILLNAYQPRTCVLGIGENGHLAFNDPPAKFYTPRLVEVVDLTLECRQQQVGEGHFSSLAEVPARAISLTIPALLNREHVLTVVPEARKAQIVRQTLTGPITPDCPASILTTLPHAKLYVDTDSAALL